ncbi:MAG: ribosome maturation factor RimM [Gammaproteobacteria bacterium]
MPACEARHSKHTEEGKDGPITVGRVCGIYGVKGWVRVYSYTQPKTNILCYSPWYLGGSNGRWLERRVVDAKTHGDGVLALLEGYEDRAQARGSMGQEIAVYRSQLPEPGLGEYYWADLIGMRVMNREGTEFGTVTGLIETGMHDVLVVQGERERLVPFVSGIYVYSIDSVLRCIAVDWDLDA